MVYVWRRGSHHKVPASIAAAECERLEAEGRLCAEELVNESREEGSPLHEEFEWRDEVAAEEYRKAQARSIINSLVVVSEQHEPVNAFVSLSVRSPEYTAIHTVMQRPDTRDALLQNALRELQAFWRKYKNLSEFAELFAELDKLTA